MKQNTLSPNKEIFVHIGFGKTVILQCKKIKNVILVWE